MRLIAALGSLLLACCLGSWVAPEVSASTAKVRVVDADAPYPEGPLWRHGRLYYTDYANSRVTVWRHGRERTFWQQNGCGASGLLPMPRSRLLVTCYDSDTLVELDRYGTVVRTIARDSAGRPFLGPNDFARAPGGGIYFSASGVYDVDAPVQGKIYHLAPGGRIHQVAAKLHYSNGLAVTPDGRHLLVAEMLANRVLGYRIRADGSLGERRVFADMRELTPGPPPTDPYTGPDGLKIGPDRRVYVAQNGTGRVVVTDLRGRFVRAPRVPARYVTNVALGPGRALFVTAAFDANAEPYPGAVYELRR
ncbi:MAG: hypothetical protein GEV10_04735 [Streptosporangiales bacterium]|nr:hypothetical protein [Streptosporangiales bacterium]